MWVVGLNFKYHKWQREAEIKSWHGLGAFSFDASLLQHLLKP